MKIKILPEVMRIGPKWVWIDRPNSTVEESIPLFIVFYEDWPLS